MSKRNCIVAVLTLLLIFSSFATFSRPLKSPVATASVQMSSVAATSESSLLQYEWPQFQGDPAFSRFSDGPAPEAPDILWKTNITGIQAYISAFNGKVFATTNTTIFALDKETGSIIWNVTVPELGPWPAVYKIDSSHMVIGNSCLDPETGKTLWTSANFSANTAVLFTYNVYCPEEKMFYTKVNSYVQAWNFANPSIPPTLAWATNVPGGGSVGSGIQYGDGKIFPGSYEPHQMALDAKTGKVLWDTETKGSMLFSGSYYQGKFIRAGSHDNTIYAFNATTGETLWTFNPNTQGGYFTVGTAVAYGMVYELNRDGYLYALDVNTGDVVWKYTGPGPLIFPGTPTVADGKVYATTGQTASYTGENSTSEFVCLDAYAGELIWRLPIEAFAPRESVAIAYGNLYLIPADVSTLVDSKSGDEYSTLNQVWAIGTRSWPMWRHDPAHSATGQSGPTDLTLRWKFTTSGAVVSSPSVTDGRVYFGSQDKNIYAVDARSGSLIWQFKTNDRIESSPAVVNGKVYTGTDDGYAYALDAYNGSLIWKTPAGGAVPASFAASVQLRSSPTVVGDRVYVGSLDTNLYCIDANTGKVNWKYKTQGYITSSPAVVEGAVYVASQEPGSGALYKLNANNGSLIWKDNLPYQIGFMGGTDMHASPTVANGMVFATSNIGAQYYGINATTGNIEWNYKDPAAEEFIICSPIYTDGQLFLIDKFSIVSVNATDGQPVWNSYLGEELYVSPSYAEGKLYVVTDERSIYVLNATSGNKLGYFGTGSNSWSAPTIYEGRVYVGNNDWNVYCLAEYPALAGNVTIELSESKAVLGESVTGFGQLTPGIANASMTLSFATPSGVTETKTIATGDKGVFNFTYTPNIVGNYTIIAQWQPNNGYYIPTNSPSVILETAAVSTPSPTPTPSLTPTPSSTSLLSPKPTPTPQDLTMLSIEYVSIIIILVVVIAIAAYVYRKRAKN